MQALRSSAQAAKALNKGRVDGFHVQDEINAITNESLKSMAKNVKDIMKKNPTATKGYDPDKDLLIDSINNRFDKIPVALHGEAKVLKEIVTDLEKTHLTSGGSINTLTDTIRIMNDDVRRALSKDPTWIDDAAVNIAKGIDSPHVKWMKAVIGDNEIVTDIQKISTYKSPAKIKEEIAELADDIVSKGKSTREQAEAIAKKKVIGDAEWDGSIGKFFVKGAE